MASAGSIKAGIMNDTWQERELYSNGVVLNGQSKSLKMVRIGNENVPMSNAGDTNDLAVTLEKLNPNSSYPKFTTVYVHGKVYTLTADQVAIVIARLSELGYMGSTALEVLDALVVTALSPGVDNTAGTIELAGASGTTAAELLAAIGAAGEYFVTMNIWNAAGAVEKTDTDVLIATDYVMVTARNGSNTWKYTISYES